MNAKSLGGCSIAKEQQMSYQYRLEEVDPKKTAEIKKKKEDDERKKRDAYTDAEDRENPQSPPAQQM